MLVEVMRVTQGESEPLVERIGTVRYARVSRVASELSGLVEKIYFTEGDRVKAGQPLIQLRNDLLKKTIESTKAGYRQELLEKRSELNYLREQLLASKRDRSASKGSYLPSIDLSLAHEEYGDSLIPGDLPDTADNDDKLMLNARWNLFDGYASRSAVAAADARTRAVAAELHDTEAELLLQLETVLHNAHIAQGRLQEAEIGVTQAVENYRVTENHFTQQQATTVDLLDAQFLLTRSRNFEINARYNLYLSAAVLDRILERDPIRIRSSAHARRSLQTNRRSGTA